MTIIKVKKLNPEAKLPSYAHEGDAGMDIYSCEDILIPAGEIGIVPTGIAMEFPLGYVALVWDKSGIASKSGIKTMAGVGDSSYRGEYKIVLFNTSNKEYGIKKGDKVAQILIQPIERGEIEEVSELGESERGEKGFGSSGMN